MVIIRNQFVIRGQITRLQDLMVEAQSWISFFQFMEQNWTNFAVYQMVIVSLQVRIME
jgi:hypothetical protein